MKNKKVGTYKRTSEFRKKISESRTGVENLKLRGRIAPNRNNLIGKRFNRLLVTDFDEAKGKSKNAYWKVVCDCGKEKSVAGNSLENGDIQSCGCLRIEKYKKGMSFKHGGSSGNKFTMQYGMWNRAHKRAVKKGLEFTIKVEDIVIPERCPLLGVVLKKEGENSELCPNSPSLDRINPQMGYTPDNIWVISQRANTSKQNLSLSELKMLVENLEQKIVEQKIHENRKS
jgi:hypothetical protein